MATPAQMYDHELNQVKGAFGGPYALDKSVVLSADETAADVKAGMTGHLDSAGEWKRGLPAPTRANVAMPLFLLQNGDAFDVVGDDGNIVGAEDDGQQGSPSALVATGAFELETTEFVTDTYAPGDTLTAATGVGATAGKLAKLAGSGAEVICGVAVRDAATNEHSVSTLRFWPCFNWTLT